MVRIVDDEVHAAQANDLMQLVTPFVDATELGHEHPYLISALHDTLRHLARDLRHFLGAVHEGLNGLGNGEDLRVLQAHRMVGGFEHKNIDFFPEHQPTGLD